MPRHPRHAWRRSLPVVERLSPSQTRSRRAACRANSSRFGFGFRSSSCARPTRPWCALLATSCEHAAMPSPRTEGARGDSALQHKAFQQSRQLSSCANTPTQQNTRSKQARLRRRPALQGAGPEPLRRRARLRRRPALRGADPEPFQLRARLQRRPALRGAGPEPLRLRARLRQRRALMVADPEPLRRRARPRPRRAL